MFEDSTSNNGSDVTDGPVYEDDRDCQSITLSVAINNAESLRRYALQTDWDLLADVESVLKKMTIHKLKTVKKKQSILDDFFIK